MPGFVNYKKGCTRLTVTSDKVYQLLAHGRWFSPGTPASSTTKTRRHDIAEILLKVALNTNNPKSIKLYDHKHDDTFIECIVFVINTFASKQIWIVRFWYSSRTVSRDVNNIAFPMKIRKENQTCSVHLYRQLLVGGLMFYLRYLCLFEYSNVQYILYVFLRFVHPMLPVSLDFPFCIAPLVSSNVYSKDIHII